MYLLYIPESMEKELFSRGRESEVGSGRRHVLLVTSITGDLETDHAYCTRVAQKCVKFFGRRSPKKLNSLLGDKSTELWTKWFGLQDSKSHKPS